MKRFMDLPELDTGLVRELVATAKHLEKHPHSDALRGKIAGLLFMNPSLRTLASMQAGMAQLGGSSFVITPGQGSWGLETRPGVVMDGDAAEHVREAIPVLSQYCDVLAVRNFAKGKDLAEDAADAVIRRMADLSPKPFMNLESAMTHPCQSLADWKTLDDLDVPTNEGRFVLSWAWHPKALTYAVPASTLNMAAQRGMKVTVLRPQGFALPGSVMATARALASKSGGSVFETDDVAAAMDGAHVLYAKSWCAPSAYGNPEADAALRASLREAWCIRESFFASARADAKFMHCLPVRRNVKVADEVLDGPRSVVVRQAGNRLHAQKAVLWKMLVDKE